MMKTVVALALIAALLAPGAVFADSSTDAALALGAFAVFNQILAGQTIFQGLGAGPAVVHRPPVIVYPPPSPPIYYTPPPVVYHVPPPPPVVVYPHGTWELRRGYWVWIPTHRHSGHWKHHPKHGYHD